MDALRLVLLGGFQLHVAGGETVPLSARKAKALLAYLALQSGQRCSRGGLAALLWEDRADTHARQSLRQMLVGLRAALPQEERILETVDDVVGLVPGTVAVDVHDFERLLDDATPEALDRAVALYRGEFLEGFDPRAPAFEDWLMAERSRLRERALEAMQQLLDHELASGAIERAIRRALRLLTLDPLREPVQRTLMELYARRGHYGAALRQYRICQRTMRRELDVAPEKATEQLYRQLVQQRQSAPDELPEIADDVPEPITAEPPTLSTAELRQVTIMLVRFVMAEDDPEALHTTLQRCHTTAIDQIRRYGGQPVQRLSNSVLAAFGMPIAHSDDAERAVRAAAGIREAFSQVHIGIASGRVMASGDAQPTVTGAAVDRATALASRAGVGEILLSASVHTSVAGRIGAERIADRGEAIWRLRELRATALAERPAFVGRHSERRQFAAALEACRETGCGQSFLVRGEAGIGKSRLLEEYAALAEQQGFVCHKVLVLDFGAAQDPVRTLVRSLLHLEPADEEERVHAAAERALAEGLIVSDQRPELHNLLVLPQPPALKGVFDAMDAATRRQRRQHLVTELVAARARRQPLLVAMEDIHWADAVTLDDLARIAAAVGDCPALLVMTHRLEGEPLDPAWRGAMQGAPLTTIDVGPLRRDEAGTLAAGLATGRSDFMHRCIERAGGNPLFLEQLLRSAADDDSAIPGSVRSIVWARLDRLSAADKRAAQAAAVLGQRFTPAALRHLLDTVDYNGAPLIEQRLLRPEGEDYQFGHALIREGIYESLLVSHRRALHRRAADWFRSRDPLLTAQHLDRAEAAEAAWAYLDAARTRMGAYRYEDACGLLARGLELARDDRERYELTYLQGEALHAAGDMDAAIAAYRRAVDLADADEPRCQAWLGVAAGYAIKDRHADALAALEQAQWTAGHRARPLAQLHGLRGNVLFPLGRIAECLQAHQHARKYAREAGSPELEARALSGLADADYLRGRMIAAYGNFDRCVQLSRGHGLTRIEASNLPMRGVTRFYRNDLEAAREDAEEAAKLAARIGHLRAEALARETLVYVLSSRAEWPVARRQAEYGLELARRLGAQRFEADFLLHLAQALLAEGRRRDAERHLDEAYALSREASLAFVGPWLLGALAAATDDADKRRRALAEGEALLATGSVSHNHLHFYQLAIDVALDNKDWQAVRRYCAALEDYVRPEPLPWSAFFIARGRALAAWRSGEHDEPTRQELQRLAREAERCGLCAALPALNAALAEE